MPQRLEPVGPEILRRVKRVLGDLHERIVDRKHHKRQVIVHHTEYDRPFRIDHILPRQADRMQHHIDDPRLLQQRLPGDRAEKKIHPHRQDKNENDKSITAHF